MSWDSKCTQCKSGRYGHLGFSKASQAHCHDCASGTYQLVSGQTSCAACSTCPAGEKRIGCGLASTGSCEACAQGSHKNGPHQWDTGCTLCGVGKYGSAKHSRTGAHHCRNCPTGQFRDATGFTDCIKCGVGQYQSATGETSCMKCIAGRFTSTKGQELSLIHI